MHRIIILKFKIENGKWNVNINKKAPNGFNSTQIIYLLDAKKSAISTDLNACLSVTSDYDNGLACLAR
jgi:hypothetical protein